MRTSLLIQSAAAVLLACAAFACLPVHAETASGVPAAGLDSGGSKEPGPDSTPPAGRAEGSAPAQSAGKDGASEGSGCGEGESDAANGRWGKGFRFGREKEIRGALGAVGLLSAVVILLLCGVSVFAFQMLVFMTFPAAIERMSKTLSERRLFSFVLGLVNCVFLWLLVVVLGKTGGPAGGFAVVFLLLLLFAVFLGLTARARIMGAKAASMAGLGSNPVLHLLLGWWTMFFVGNIPIVGWTLALYWGLSGTGGLVLSLFSGGAPRNPPAAGAEPKDEYQSPVVKI